MELQVEAGTKFELEEWERKEEEKVVAQVRAREEAEALNVDGDVDIVVEAVPSPARRSNKTMFALVSGARAFFFY